MNCRPVLETQECINGLLPSPVCAVLQTDDPRVNGMNVELRMTNTSVNYVCRENVEGILHINDVCLIILAVRQYQAQCSHFVS